MSIITLSNRKKKQQKITMVTCYDYPSAKIINETDIDAVLVGDSVAMVVHGHENTTTATLDMMALHTQAVAKGLKKALLVADLPFMSYRKSLKDTMIAVERLVHAGAQAIKLEGADDNLETIRYIVNSGVPVMGHLGLTPQSIHQLGGFKVQGKLPEAQAKLLENAKQLEAAGCFSLVLECIPSSLAQTATQHLNIPTIGIGAGSYTDGQILVWHDVLGIQNELQPKFLKQYHNAHDAMQKALGKYAEEVKQSIFPNESLHSY